MSVGGFRNARAACVLYGDAPAAAVDEMRNRSERQQPGYLTYRRPIVNLPSMHGSCRRRHAGDRRADRGKRAGRCCRGALPGDAGGGAHGGHEVSVDGEHPRAHITNQRTVEIFRDLEIEDDIKASATPQRLMGDTVFCTSLSGDEIGRVRTWGTHPARQADYTLASPSENCDLPQTLLEPILIGHAAARGSRIRFDTEYLGLEQDAAGVTVEVVDRLSGQQYSIRAKYLIGADGGRSKIADDVGLPFEGEMDIAGSMNIVFHADLSSKVAHRPSVLYWVLQPGSEIGGIGMGLVRMVRPWDEWLVVWGYDINQSPPELDDAEAAQIVRNLIGDDTLPVTIRSTSLWGNNKMYASRYRSGRVFCMGDAVHRHPPSNGLGSNTSVQDAYNLAWKLAFVLSGQAGAGLLDSYDAERAPVGKQIVLEPISQSRNSHRSLMPLGLAQRPIPRGSRSACGHAPITLQRHATANRPA